MTLKHVLILLSLVLIAPTPISAQTSVEIRSVWGDTSAFCTAHGGCGGQPRVTESGNLYLTVRGGYRISLGSGGIVAGEYDLSGLDIPFGGSSGFEVIQDRYVVFFVLISRGYALMTYDLQTQQFIALDPALEELSFEGCEAEPGIQGFKRLGHTTELLVCSRNTIHRVDGITGNIIQSFTLDGPNEGIMRPWREVVGGLDGNIYVSSYAESRAIRQLFPDVDPPSYPTSTRLIMRYSTVEALWSLTTVDLLPIMRTDPCSIDEYYYRRSFLYVDNSGNLYVTLRCAYQASIDIGKFDPQGQLLWHITEADLGGVPLYVDLIAEDQFLISDSDHRVQMVNVETSALTSTPTP